MVTIGVFLVVILAATGFKCNTIQTKSLILVSNEDPLGKNVNKIEICGVTYKGWLNVDSGKIIDFSFCVIVGDFRRRLISTKGHYPISDYHTWDTEKISYDLGNNKFIKIIRKYFVTYISEFYKNSPV